MVYHICLLIVARKNNIAKPQMDYMINYSIRINMNYYNYKTKNFFGILKNVFFHLGYRWCYFIYKTLLNESNCWHVLFRFEADITTPLC